MVWSFQRRVFFLALVCFVLDFCRFENETSAKSDNLEFISSFNIKDKSAGLTEPSGLTFSHDKNSFLVVSDDTSKIFRLKLNGDLESDYTISIPGLDGLEGVAVGIAGRDLFVVAEDFNEVIRIDRKREEISRRIALSTLTGYEGLVRKRGAHFPDKGYKDKKGLEGITIHPVSGNLFVLKESGLLIEISADLKRILKYRELNFADDYSGICFQDAGTFRLWVLSDDSKKVFLYDWASGDVLKKFKLRKKRGKKISSAEGIAFNPLNHNLFIITDRGHKLYRFLVK